MIQQKRAGLPALFFITTFIIGCLLYARALHGPFVLDDPANFYKLKFVTSVPTILDYLFKGESGLRWAAYLSFIPHADAFTHNDAFPFKLGNLLIHGVNAILAFFLVSGILKRLPTFPYPPALAWLIAGAWFVHPIHVGTVLYSVQRMTLLSATFVMAGCLYALFCTRHTSLASARHWLIHSTGLWLFTFMAISSKENGILLLGFVALLHYQLDLFKWQTWQRHLTLFLPLLAMLVILATSNRLSYAMRDFSMAERLLSELVILQEYVIKILLPGPHSFSLFHDDFRIVRSATDPRLLLALAFWSSLLLFVHMLDKYARGTALGISWFLVGHSLESSFIPLELYFDHRNYLPSLGLVLATGLVLARFRDRAGGSRHRLLATILAATLIANLLIGLQRETRAWTSSTSLAWHIYQGRPNSLRAMQYLAESQYKNNQWQEALVTVSAIQQQFGITPSNLAFQLSIACLANPELSIPREFILEQFTHSTMDQPTAEAMENLFTIAREGQCTFLDLETYRAILRVVLPKNPDRKQTHNLYYLLMSSYVVEAKYNEALTASLEMPFMYKTMPFLFQQMDVAIRANNKTVAAQLYAEIGKFDSMDKVIYKDQIQKIDLFMQGFLNER